jgi:hypothetical protein
MTAGDPRLEGFSPNDFRIPTLRELLARFPDTLINLELKPDPDSTGSYEGKLAAILAEFGRSDDVIVASFLDTASAAFKAQAPQVSTSVPTVQVALSIATGQGPSPGITIGHDAFQVPIEFSGVPVINQEFVDDAHAQGLAVQAWTINNATDMKMLLCLGVDGIMTDRPSLLRSVLESDWQASCDRPPPGASSSRSPGLLGLLGDYLSGLGQALLLGLGGDMPAAQDRFLAAAGALAEGVTALLTDDPDHSLVATLGHLADNLGAVIASLTAGDPAATPVAVATTINDAGEDVAHLLGLSRVVPDAQASCAPDNDGWQAFATFKGSLHEHSGYSDGTPRMEPRDYFAAGRNLGLDFMGSSEHSDNADAPFSVPDESCLAPDGVNCLVADNDNPVDAFRKWDATLEQAHAESDANFTAFRGFEWTSDRFGHINVFFSKHDYNAKTTEGYALSMESFWTWFDTRPEFGGGSDGLGVFNHPGREDAIESNLPNTDPAYAFNDFEYRPQADLRMVGVEVFGKGGDAYDTDNNAPAGGWYAHALDKGWHVGPVGAEDEHGTEWAKPNRAKTILIARDRSEGALREAMFARRMYAVAQNSNDIRLSFTADDQPMGSRLARAVNAPVEIAAEITQAMPAGGRLELVSNGGQRVASSITSTLSHEVNATVGERWYYLRVLRSDGRPVAYSSPIWIKGGGAYPTCGEWVAGDLHVHTTYSHDSYGGPNEVAEPLSPVAGDILPGDDNTGPEEFYVLGLSVTSQFRLASARGLDYLAITDHNDVRSQTDRGFGAFGVVPVSSYENSLSGHAQMHGANRIYDKGNGSAAAINDMADALRQDGGVFQINHPADKGGAFPDSLGWSYGFQVRPDTIEVWNIGARLYQAPFPSNTNNDDSTRYWEQWLNLGSKVAATGGSDSHWASLAAIQGAGMPSTWVFVTERSEYGVLKGLKQGRTFISHLPPLNLGPRLYLEADHDGDGIYESHTGDSVPAAAALRVRVQGAPGSLLRIVSNGDASGEFGYRQVLGPIPAVTPVYEHRFSAPAGATWLRAEIIEPDLQAQRRQAEPVCAQLAQLGDAGFPEDTRTTYCRNQLGILAMTSAIYFE